MYGLNLQKIKKIELNILIMAHMEGLLLYQI